VIISYKKLWKLLIDKDLKKTDLLSLAGISKATLNKLSHNQNVTTDILIKVCKALNCNISDIAEISLTTNLEEGNNE
jgi:DNA-binding Xre family transcriptional regulator